MLGFRASQPWDADFSLPAQNSGVRKYWYLGSLTSLTTLTEAHFAAQDEGGAFLAERAEQLRLLIGAPAPDDPAELAPLIVPEHAPSAPAASDRLLHVVALAAAIWSRSNSVILA
jgi:hypothetical protein